MKYGLNYLYKLSKLTCSSVLFEFLCIEIANFRHKVRVILSIFAFYFLRISENSSFEDNCSGILRNKISKIFSNFLKGTAPLCQAKFRISYSRNADPSVAKRGVKMLRLFFYFINVVLFKKFFKFFIPAFLFNNWIPTTVDTSDIF